MTRTHEASSARTASRSRRTLDVDVQRLAAIDQSHTSRKLADAAAEAVAKSREDRRDLTRRREVLRRQHEAMIAQSHQQFRATAEARSFMAEPRVMLAHRSEWFTGKISGLLHEHGVRITATVSNGAEAIGAAIAEQPDLVLVEDSLEMVSGVQVITEVHGFCPDTLITAQVAYSDDVGRLLDAGVDAVFTRKMPPADVARDLLRLLARTSATSHE